MNLWYYEYKFFDLSIGMSYTPDFFIPTHNKYIEIKGYWRDRAKEKFELFRKEYPDISIDLLFFEDLRKLGVL